MLPSGVEGVLFPNLLGYNWCKMRVLVLGAKGNLGTELLEVLADYEVVAKGHEELDVTDFSRLEGFVRDLRPEALINCAAWTDVDGCESDPRRAFLVNAIGARNVALSARKVGAKLVYISTDYVFDGTKEGPYVEFDPPRPINAYGMSKLLGERFVKEQHPESFILRTAWLYGRKGKNFPRAILSLLQQRDELRVVNDQKGTPTWARDLARQIKDLINTEAYGLYHASSEGSCTWFEFARELLGLLGNKEEEGADGTVVFRIKGKAVRLKPVKTEEFPRPAKRPRNSVLENFLLKVQGLNVMPDWRKSLGRFVEEIKEGGFL